MRNPQSMRGVALLTALLITAIATIIAVGMAARQQLDIRRAGNVLDGDQAYLYTLGMDGLTQLILEADLREDKKAGSEVDSLEEPWAAPIASIAIEGGKLAGRIEDLQGRFNLNNLQPVQTNPPSNNPPSDSVAKAIFQRLLVGVGKVNAGQAQDMTEAVADWLDADEVLRTNGAEDNDYLLQKPPYRAANARFTSPSELLLIKGFTPAIYKLIAPYVCALPATTTTINVNTVPVQVIAALDANINTIQIVSRRALNDFKTVGDFFGQAGLNAAAQQLITPKLSVSSHYFLLSAHATAGRGQVQLYSLLERLPPTSAQAKAAVKVIMRGQGTY